MSVRRTLPQRALPTVGAWCFLDHFGPQQTNMRVLPHPHIGLQTVTWPLSGEIRHRDSLGSNAVLRPSQLNLMTSGRGVVHSEFSLDSDEMLQALQLWVALPADRAQGESDFERHTELPVFEAPGVRATVIIGAMGGSVSPATTYTPLLGADLVIDAEATIPLRPDFEHAALLLDGTATIAGQSVTPGPLLYLGTGRSDLTLTGNARILLLGGEPFPDELVMWWNFVGRSHEEIAAARQDWEADNRDRFPLVEGHGNDRIPAPPLPAVRLTPRRRH
jgi:redox-sensitive bicupin YhaK (pirin superfamily)